MCETDETEGVLEELWSNPSSGFRKGCMYDMCIVISRCKEYGLYNGTPEYYGSTRTILLY